MSENVESSGFRKIAAALLAGTILAWAAPALAQEEDAAPSVDSPADASAEITVTGSRVARKGFDAPTPTTVLDAATLAAKSPRTLVESLAYLPAFRGTATPSTGGAVAAGSGGGGFLNLRGLGSNRTLVLMDRQRLMPVNVNGDIDVSLLPTALLSGVDVVTGGASAAWGSDAVAGVANFRLDSRYTGLTLQAESGISHYSDAVMFKLGGKFGFELGGNFHIVGALEHEENKGVTSEDARSRDFGRVDYANFPNPSAPPANAILPFVYQRETFGGLIVGGALNNQQIMPDGSLAPYVPCGPLSASNTYLCPTLRPDLPWGGYFTSLYSPLNRTTGFVRASWDASPGLTIYADLLAGKSKTNSFTLPATAQVNTIGALTVNRDNAYLPAALATAMDANGLTSVTMRRWFRDQGPLAMTREAGMIRGSLGFKAELGGSWKLDGYGAYAASKLDAIFNNVVVLQNLKNAVDSVRIGGVPTCRVNADANPANDDPACRPINFFGDGALLTTPEGRDYYTEQGFSKTRSHQFSAALTLSGEPFSTWAGPVSFASGVEYRSLTSRIDVDAISAAKRFFAINAQPLAGSVNVKEAFGEVVVPLATDLPFARKLELNAAGRITNYSTSGTVKTWKLGLNYEPTSGIRFRGTLSQDIRAPNINELFSAQTQTIGTSAVIDPKDNSTPSIRVLAGGNPALVPEVAKTKSIGVVLQPQFLPGFQLSVDYYDISVAQAITTPTAQQIVNQCAAGSTASCNLVYRNDIAGASTGTITRVDSVFVNLAQFKTRGLDFEASYRFPLGDGNVRLSALANYTDLFTQKVDTVTVNSTDSQVNPHWTGDASITYDNNGFDFYLGGTYRGGGRINANFTRAALANNYTGSVTYINTAVGQAISVGDRKMTFRLSINNLFNVKPPYGYPQVVTGDSYDRVGRYYKASVKFEM